MMLYLIGCKIRAVLMNGAHQLYLLGE